MQSPAMRRVIHHLRRNKALVALTAVLMAGAGCVGVVRTTGDQLTDEAMQPITVPIEAYRDAQDAAADADAAAQERGMLQE